MKIKKTLLIVFGLTIALVIAQAIEWPGQQTEKALAHCPWNDPLHCASHVDPTTDSDGDGCGDGDITCNPHYKKTASELWGEAGRGLYSAASEFMTRDNVSIPRRSISSQRKQILRQEFGSLVDRVTIQYGADMLDRWGSGDFSISQGSAGQTFCNKIYISAPYRENSDYQLILLAHELEHSRQCERLGGMSNFGYHYFKEYRRGGLSYSNNDLEEEAERIEERLAGNYYRRYGKKFNFRNNCSYPVRLGLRYRDASSGWKTGGWWNFDANERSYLSSGGSSVRSDNRIFYYYAEVTEEPHTDYSWSGDENKKLGNRTLPMRQVRLTAERDGLVEFYRLSIGCSNLP